MSDALKAGATLNRQNRTRLQSMHDMAVEMGAQCSDAPDTTPIGKMAACPHCGHSLVETAKAGLLGADEGSATPYASIKALADRHLEVKVAYHGHKDGKDSHNEYFDANTDFAADDFPTPPLLYYHGFDEHGKRMGRPVTTGKFISRRAGIDGHYLTYKLKSTRYADLQWNAALKGECVVSPGTVGHLIRKSPDGHLDYWPLAEVSAWDYAANRAPANLHSVAAPVLKALYLAEQIPVPQSLDAPETAGDAVAGVTDISLDDQAKLIATIVADGLRTYRKETGR